MNKLVGLVQLVREISGTRDAEEIYEPALSALHAIVGVDRSAILLLDEAGIARFVAWRDLSDTYRVAVEGHFPWSIDDPAACAIVSGNVMQDASLSQLRPILEREGVRACAFIPLIYRERLVGKFMLYFDRPHVFEDEEVELAKAIAYLVAFAIERTRLYAALEESDRRKDIFLATLAHELRNPLAPASAALAIMAERPDDLATIRGVRPVLDRSIKQIAKLVDDLLDVSRITRGMIVIEKQPVELAGIVQQALAPIQPLIASQHQELTLSLHELWVDADPLRLEQVITNLIHNAAKYSATGGHIWVSTTAKDGGIELRVRDDGIGIDPEILPRLFDMFVQVDTSLARTQGGLGIGLTIVRKLVELHGGTVRATSAGEGRGSEFIVWLPGRLEPRTAAPAPSPERSRSARRIVVVDDNEDAADTLAMLLRVRGHEVAIARDGPSAITTVAEQHPEIVLLDLGLPGMTGYDVARHLRASNASDLRIVAVSGYGQPEDIARAHAAGCDAHLAKPVDLDALARLLDAG